MQNKKPGYDKEQIMFLPDATLLGNNQEAFKQRVLLDTRVVSASISRFVPAGSLIDGTQISSTNELLNEKEIHTNIYRVDYDYLKTLGIQLLYGRNFSQDFTSDSFGTVINESAVRELGWTNSNAVGKFIYRPGLPQLKVVGVIANFNYISIKHKIEPLMLLLGKNNGGLIIKFKTNDINGLIDDLKNYWKSFNPAGPINYEFLDDKFAALYENEKHTKDIFSFFTILAIVIASLGLFGLSAFAIEHRTKEIGVRKVLGASITSVVELLTKEYLIIVVYANLIAYPVAYFFMNKWLQDFESRIEISWWMFVLSGGIALLIALVTVSLQAIKAATANPVDSLKYE